MKLAIIFGSSSNEHDVSVVSAASIIKNLDKDKYKITPIYLNKNVFFLQFSCIITSKILHIIKVMCKKEK